MILFSIICKKGMILLQNENFSSQNNLNDKTWRSTDYMICWKSIWDRSSGWWDLFPSLREKNSFFRTLIWLFSNNFCKYLNSTFEKQYSPTLSSGIFWKKNILTWTRRLYLNSPKTKIDKKGTFQSSCWFLNRIDIKIVCHNQVAIA